MALSENLTLIGIFVTAVGSIASVVGIILVLSQVRGSQKIAKGEFLLHLAELLGKHDAAYQAVMPDKNWSPGKDGVTSLDMENYMSLFEQFKVLIDYGIIDFKVFERLYGYRIMLIVANDEIFNTSLQKYAVGWPDFIELCKMVAHSRHHNEIPAGYAGAWKDRWATFVQRTDKLQVIR